MDLYDTATSTDLVVAEGDTLRGWHNYSKRRPMGSSRLGQAVPLHLLHSTIPSHHGARLYSSSTSPSLPRPLEEQTTGDLQTNVNPSLLPTPTPTDGPDSGFASLRGLFGNPRRSWSPPETENHATDAISDTQFNRSTQELNPSDDSFDVELDDNHPDRLSSGAEEDERAHEMLSSIPTVKAQLSTVSSAEQVVETNNAKVIMPDRSSPLPLRKHIAKDMPKSSQVPVQVIRFKKASKNSSPREVARNAEAAKRPNQREPNPLPAWKVTSEDTQLLSPSNQRNTKTSTASNKDRTKTSTASASTKSPESVQSGSLTSTSLSEIDVEQNESTLAQLLRSETESLDPMRTMTAATSSSLEEANPTDAATATALTHLTPTGEAHMVDVGGKDFTERVAVAVGFVHFSNSEAYRLITQNLNKKGDVLGVARIAGIMAAKKCSDIIPLCHPIPITKITLNVGTLSPENSTPLRSLLGCHTKKHGVAAVEARVHTRGQTGVEMEALTAVSGACLTIYDMCKAVDKNMIISGARVLYKDGGRSGTYLCGQFAKHPVPENFIKMDQDTPPPASSEETPGGQ